MSGTGRQRVHIDCGYIEGVTPLVSDSESDCPLRRDHTPEPEGYMQRLDWMQAMSRTHRQVQCRGCGLWAIWVPKSPGRGGTP